MTTDNNQGNPQYNYIEKQEQLRFWTLTAWEQEDPLGFIMGVNEEPFDLHEHRTLLWELLKRSLTHKDAEDDNSNSRQYQFECVWSCMRQLELATVIWDMIESNLIQFTYVKKKLHHEK